MLRWIILWGLPSPVMALADTRLEPGVLPGLKYDIRQPLPFPSTGSWNTWREQVAVAPLKEGMNRIRIESCGDSGGNIDSLRIEGIRQL
ncbi:MAG: hypothetical protein VCG02_13110 [Verrucomicrobiota bacterium]